MQLHDEWGMLFSMSRLRVHSTPFSTGSPLIQEGGGSEQRAPRAMSATD